MTEPRPEQCWYFGLAAPDWSLFARLALSPRLGTASWWALVARCDEPLLVVRDESLALPKRTLEVRGPGLWADLTCHEPLRRWQLNFEGIAVALDDPNEASGKAYGDLVAMEFEFEWESTAPPRRAANGGYTVACEVHGELEMAGEGVLRAVASHGWHGYVTE